MRENDLLTWLRSHVSTTDPAVLVPLGVDDCALLQLTSPATLGISTDMFLEGTHFLSTASAHEVGWKCMAAALSDLAASACDGRWAVVALGIRQGLGGAWAQGLGQGLIDCAAPHGVSLIGGDTTSGPGAMSIAVTVMGPAMPGGPVRRDGARPGDVVAVTGTLGGSLAGRHLHPEPRFEAMRALLKLGPLHAAMDISDGLAVDLSRLAQASGCGACIEAEAIPIDTAAASLSAASGRSPLQHALGDGEDFELLVTMDETTWGAVEAGWPHAGVQVPIRAVGRMTADTQLILQHTDGPNEPLELDGYEHSF